MLIEALETDIGEHVSQIGSSKSKLLGLRTRPAVGRFAAHSVEPFAAAVAEQDALSAL